MAKNQKARSQKVSLDANGVGHVNQGGGVFMFASSLSTVSVDVTWLDEEGNEAGKIESVLLGQIIAPGGYFSGVHLSGGDPDDDLQVIVGPADSYIRQSANEITIGHVIIDNQVEIKNDAGNPLPVSQSEAGLPRGATVTDATNAGLVAVDDAGIQLVAAGATRKSVRFRNAGANAVALLAAIGNDFDNAAVIIQPGEAWNEIEAPGAAWYGKCAAGLDSEIAVQTVLP